MKLLKKTPMFLLKLIAGIIFLYPVLLILFNSFKPYDEMMGAFLALPKQIAFDKYFFTWEKMRFADLFINSLLYSVTITVITVIASSMAGYKLARTKTKLAAVLSVLLILPLMVPFQSFMMTMTRQAVRMGLSGTQMGYILIMSGLFIPFATFLVRNFMVSVPLELEECATIDGAGPFRTYWQIVLPLLNPVIITIVVIDVINIWNDFFIQLLLLGGKKDFYNIQYALYAEFSIQSSNWEMALPGIVIALVPVVVFFLVLQQRIVEGIASGAVKA